MLRIYCRGRHSRQGDLCEECAALQAYAMCRLDRCPFGAEKPACADCPIHCYRADRREEIRAVMRYSGPRMLWRHPLLAIQHLLDGRRPAPSSPRKRSGDAASTTDSQSPPLAAEPAVGEKNWHEVKLLDVSGEPYNDENVAKDEFEKEAVRQLKSGEAYVDRVEKREDGRYLRAATALPVVLEKCIMCHENYKQAKPGQAIGMLSYTLKIE